MWIIYATHDCDSAVDSVATDFICEIGPFTDAQEHAEYVVRAVNNHEELVTLLSQALFAFEDVGVMPDLCEHIASVLAKAKGG